MTIAKGWWNQATRDDAANCRTRVFEFLNDPNPEDTEKCARALALYILLGGDDTAICDRVDKIQQSPQMVRVRDALASCAAMLLQAQAAMPEKLQKSNQELINRDEKAFAERRPKISKPFKFKPHPK